MEKTKILVVDDDPSVKKLVATYLKKMTYNPDTADGVDTALDLLKSTEYHIVITDKNMPSPDNTQTGGMYLTKYIRQYYPASEVIMMTGFGSIDSAIDAMKSGAFDYITKPFREELLKDKIERILEYRKFINPNNTIPVYKTFHSFVIKIIEENGSISPEREQQLLKILDNKIDHFFKVHKKCEHFVLVQQEALGKIAGYADQLKESLSPDDSLNELVDRIILEAQKRL